MKDYTVLFPIGIILIVIPSLGLDWYLLRALMVVFGIIIVVLSVIRYQQLVNERDLLTSKKPSFPRAIKDKILNSPHVNDNGREDVLVDEDEGFVIVKKNHS